MDICLGRTELDLYNDNATRIYTQDTASVPHYVGRTGSIKRSIVNQGAAILGEVDSCVISDEVIVCENAVCTRCVIMQGALIKQGAKVHNAIIGPNAVIEEGEEINLGNDEIVLISKGGKK